jgi:hypothetical protein
LLAQQDRITGAIDARRAVAIRGSVPRQAQPKYDRGAVAPDFLLGNITLMLSPSAAQQAALEQLLAAQQDPASPPSCCCSTRPSMRTRLTTSWPGASPGRRPTGQKMHRPARHRHHRHPRVMLDCR